MADDHAPPSPPRDTDDDDLDAYLASLPLISEAQYQAELAEDNARADAAEDDYAAGRFITLEAVGRWLESLDTDNPLPRPQCGE